MPSAKPDRRLLLPLRDALKKLPDGVGGIELALDRADHAFGERYFSTGPVMAVALQIQHRDCRAIGLGQVFDFPHVILI
jgi:hypothetical protein